MFTILLYPDGTEYWRDIRKVGVVPQDAAAATTLFTVTGDVIVRHLFGVCKASLTSGGAITAEVGVSGNTAVIIPQLADAKTLIINEIWEDATPTATIEALSFAGAAKDGFIISNGQDVILTPSGTFTAGTIDFYCSWKPLSGNGKVEAA